MTHDTAGRSALLFLLCLASACPGTESPPDAADLDAGQPDAAAPAPDAGAPDAAFPPAKTDRTSPRGYPDTLEATTWNIENFPQAPETPELVADLIASMDLDLVAVEEIADTDAFDELMVRLDQYDAVLSSDTYSDGTYQKIAFIYRRDRLTVEQSGLLYPGNGYAFPRPPLEVHFAYQEGDAAYSFIAVGLHLKAGFAVDDVERRTEAFTTLDNYVQNKLDQGETRVVLLGDFNTVLSHPTGQATFGPLYDNPDRYTLLTLPLAEQGAASFLPSGQILDHVVVTTAWADTIGGEYATIPNLDDELVTYRGAISDHLPVVGVLPHAP